MAVKAVRVGVTSQRSRRQADAAALDAQLIQLTIYQLFYSELLKPQLKT